MMPRRINTEPLPRTRARVTPQQPIDLDQVLNGPRPGLQAPEADVAWLDARRALGAAAVGHPRFDHRRVLLLEGRRLHAWRERYRDWAAGVLAAERSVL